MVQTTIKNDIKKHIEMLMDFRSENEPKMVPKWTPKSTRNRSWGRLGTIYVPKMPQEYLQHPILMILAPFLVDFGSI